MAWRIGELDAAPFSPRREGKRAWRLAVRAAGKERTITLLLPEARAALEAAPAPAPGASNQSGRFCWPRRGHQVLLRAMEELLEAAPGPSCRALVELGPIVGVHRASAGPLEAGRQLVLAATARTDFERHVLASLEALESLRPLAVDNLRQVLKSHWATATHGEMKVGFAAEAPDRKVF